MFQKGDYVILKQTATYNCKPLPGYLIQLTNPIECSGIIVINNKRLVFSLHEILRPAVLSDWAVEIPGVGTVIMVKYFDNDIRYIYLTSAFKDSFLVPTWIADALSAHYGIPIMKEETYRKYMEEQK